MDRETYEAVMDAFETYAAGCRINGRHTEAKAVDKAVETVANAFAWRFSPETLAERDGQARGGLSGMPEDAFAVRPDGVSRR
jgi:hypothetical protein